MVSPFASGDSFSDGRGVSSEKTRGRLGKFGSRVVRTSLGAAKGVTSVMGRVAGRIFSGPKPKGSSFFASDVSPLGADDLPSTIAVRLSDPLESPATTTSTPHSPGFRSTSSGEPVQFRRTGSPVSAGSLLILQALVDGMWEKYLSNRSADTPKLSKQDYHTIVETGLRGLAKADWSPSFKKGTFHTDFYSFSFTTEEGEQLFVAAQRKNNVKKKNPAGAPLRFYFLPLAAVVQKESPQLIGEGASGKVAKAGKHTGCEVAAKMSAPFYPGDPTGGFKIEVRFYEKLKGKPFPHVQEGPKSAALAKYELEDDEGDVLIIEMFFGRFYPGGNAKERLPNLSFGEKLRLLQNLKQALEPVHRRRVVHSDLKLENMVCDEKGAWHLIDFGCSYGSKESFEGGTPSYMTTDSQALYGSQEFHLREKAEYVAFGILAFDVLTGGQFGEIGPQKTHDSPRILPVALEEHEGLKKMAKYLDEVLETGEGEKAREAIITLVRSRGSLDVKRRALDTLAKLKLKNP